MRFYKVMKINEMQLCMSTWVDFINTIFSEINQPQKMFFVIPVKLKQQQQPHRLKYSVCFCFLFCFLFIFLLFFRNACLDGKTIKTGGGFCKRWWLPLEQTEVGSGRGMEKVLCSC